MTCAQRASKALHHAQRANDFGVALHRIREHLPLRAAVRRSAGGAARHSFGQYRHGHDCKYPEQRRQADCRVKQEQRDQEDRNPGHVEEGGRSHARHEGANLIEVPQRLLHLHRLDAAQRQRRKRGLYRILQAGIEQGRDPAQHARPQRVQIALHQIGKQHHQRQAEQRCDVAAGNDPVIDLQHIKRAGEHQQIDDAAEERDADHSPRAVAQPAHHGIVGRGWR